MEKQVNAEALVDKFYKMDPDTEDILLDGTELQNEMCVLIESPIKRNDTSLIARTLLGQYWLNINNRWCTVTKLKLDYTTSSISFVAVYADGLKAKRQYDMSYAWIVKKGFETRPFQNEVKPFRYSETIDPNSKNTITITEEDLFELDRCARAYGWEAATIGHQEWLPDVFTETSDLNPFMARNWRRRVQMTAHNHNPEFLNSEPKISK